ncbi:alkaline phosphatase D family protein, partial [Pirellulales bacterium]|nr:alkaline phosphatase D family protein [Pirellulales bacterium]
MQYSVRNLVVLFACYALSALSAAAQESKPDDQPPEPVAKQRLRLGGQYKRIHQGALKFILAGRYAETEASLHRFLDEQPADPESHFLLALSYTQRGETKLAVDAMRQAIELGLPAGRLLAGPRELIEPLLSVESFQSLVEPWADQPIHGPLLGNVTDTSASFWIRSAAEAEVALYIRRADSLPPDADDDFFLDKQAVASSHTREDEDYTTIVTAGGLSPGASYVYGLSINGGPVRGSREQRFSTFPARDEPARFKIAFGGGAGFVPPHERMWTTIKNDAPLALLLLGDNVYIDDPKSPAMQRYTYYRRQSRPEWRNLTGQTAVFTIWDDHDFSVNDSWGGPRVEHPWWKLKNSWPIFKQNWANPAYASGDQPGCWYAFSIGDVRFIMLDCRYYRTNPKLNSPSMLGPVQLAWLKDQLTAEKKQSKRGFTVLCSSVPWTFGTKGGSKDTWNGYRRERDEIFAHLEQQQIEGVLLLSADRHRSDAWRIDRKDDYDLFEFSSSRLTNQHVHPEMKNALFSFNKNQSYGRLTFDTVANDPQVSYDVVTIDGETVHSLTVKRSQLR